MAFHRRLRRVTAQARKWRTRVFIIHLILLCHGCNCNKRYNTGIFPQEKKMNRYLF